MKFTETDYKRFMAKVDKTDSCWLWTGYKDADGYGRMVFKTKRASAHRLSYGMFNGDLNNAPVVMHTCDVRNCVNPAHLQAGTQTENHLDMVSKNRNAKGEDMGLSKLTEQKVKEIRDKFIPWKYSQRRLAKEYGVSQVNIGRIVRKEIWRHV